MRLRMRSSIAVIDRFRCKTLAAGREDVTETPTGWGVHEDVFCAGKEAVFDFLEGVLAEVIAIFPSRFLHIGGDEVLLFTTPTGRQSPSVRL